MSRPSHSQVISATWPPSHARARAYTLSSRSKAGSPRPHAPTACFVASSFLFTMLSLVITASPAAADSTTLYTYAAGGATSPTSCPETDTTSDQCTLAEALSLG